MSLRVPVVVIAAVLGLTAGCGQGGGETSVAPAPKDPQAAATGTLRFFAYGDTVTDELLDPFREQNPDVDLQNWAALYFKDNYARLQAVKARWDPTNQFRHAQSVRLPGG